MMRKLTLLWALSLLLLPSCNRPERQEEKPDDKDQPQNTVAAPDIFVKGMEGIHTFRIPAIVKTTKGTLVAFCEGRVNSGSDTGFIRLILRRSTDGGKTWGPIIKVWEDPGNTCGNPCPVVDPRTGRIHLMMTWNNGKDGKSAGDFNKPGMTVDTRRVWYTYSDDDALTWTVPVQCTSSTKLDNWGWYATGPCHAIILEKGAYQGRILMPCDHNVIGGSGYSHVVYSDNGGKTWQIGGEVKGGNESCVAELEDGTVVMTCRNSSGQRKLAWSKDGGLTFDAGTNIKSLPDPTCQAAILSTVIDGETVLIHSNCATNSRTNLTVKASRDGGKTWTTGHQIHAGPAAYSDIVMVSDTHLGVFYENGASSSYEKISFVTIPVRLALTNVQ